MPADSHRITINEQPLPGKNCKIELWVRLSDGTTAYNRARIALKPFY